MTMPTPPIDPLDPHELELARILRALPGGEPSAALDARILRAAQHAVDEPAPRRRALWAAGGSSGALWGIGSAAAAILAVGIGWRMTVPPDSALPVPRAVSMSDESAADQESTSVEFVEPVPSLQDSTAPPPPPAVAKAAPPAQAQRRDAPLERKAVASAPLPEPFAEESRENVLAKQAGESAYEPAAAAPSVATGAAASAQELEGLAASEARAMGEARDAREAYTRRRQESVLAETAAGAAPAAPAPAPAEADAMQDLGAIAAPGSRLAVESTTQARTRVLSDRDLLPDAWLTRIRERRTANDMAGARASLRLFVERHPRRTVPSDLRPLLDE